MNSLASSLRRFVATASLFALALGMALPVHAQDRTVRSKIAPTYPEIAKRMHISGAVRLDVSVDNEGKVTDVKVLNGNRVLGQAAEDAVRKWHFAPGDSTTESIDINFNLAN